ncbi:MAG: GerMN domain-containing protein [Clostridium sp.]|uniref:GerMN domain-containing protein n=1 Tax=Clostridium TaxID=1485 RepID=UPI00232DBF2A|nr:MULTISPECIES: GerMN domain-containing protein [Clostridium]MDB2119185.1 GerMN domain-containing protein [Clostridium paraputrificum]MDU2753534.1 GerMN domain-containing protein [Clostridium sp.]MDU2899099.1 GerMN domain-containing protein [Clostridium sp.]MDU4425636.1 GerMN domain-containing protein [Clostridium sp.]MDU7459364.1 GerMN domain-containing protein [Clostridium sp.]
MKKRILSIILISFSMLLFTSCSENNVDKNNEQDHVEASSPETDIKNEDNKEDLSDSNTGKTEEKQDTNVSVLPPEKTTDKVEKEETPIKPKTISKTLRLYFHDPMSDKKIYLSKNVNITDNAIVTAIINEFKNPPNSSYVAINPNAGVSSAKVNKEANLLTVDFNNSILTKTFGSGIEGYFLQGVVNTLGYNLGVSNVRITINGKGYSSGHIDLGSSDYFSVNYNGWNPIN